MCGYRKMRVKYQQEMHLIFSRSSVGTAEGSVSRSLWYIYYQPWEIAPHTVKALPLFLLDMYLPVR